MGGANWMRDYIANKNRRAKTQVNTQVNTQPVSGADKMPSFVGNKMKGYKDIFGNTAEQLDIRPPGSGKLQGKEILPGGVMPKYNGPSWQLPAYGVKTPQDYRDKILSGSAFGVKPNARDEARRMAAAAVSGNENLGYQVSPEGDMRGGGYTFPTVRTPEQDAQVKAWGNAVDYEDASDRSARRARELPASGKGLFGDVGDAIGRSMSNVIPWQLKWLNVMKNNTTGTGKFPAMVDQPPAPLSNKAPAPSPMPAYTGDGGGGYGGGGWGGGWGGGGGGGGSYDPVTKKWLANMASWRI
jgi:hypothetical protein